MSMPAKKAFVAVCHLNPIYFVILWYPQLYPTIDFYFEKTAKSCFYSCVLVFFQLDCGYLRFSLLDTTIQAFHSTWALLLQKECFLYLLSENCKIDLSTLIIIISWMD